MIERKKEEQRQIKKYCLCVCVCVWVRERKRERESLQICHEFSNRYCDVRSVTSYAFILTDLKI
jgi:hypothetical protein